MHIKITDKKNRVTILFGGGGGLDHVKDRFKDCSKRNKCKYTHYTFGVIKNVKSEKK